MIEKRDVIYIEYVTIVESILDYQQFICNSVMQKYRKNLGFVPNCLIKQNAEKLLEDLGYKENDSNTWILDNDDIYSEVIIVPAKIDELSIAVDPKNNAYITGEHWKDYPKAYLFKIIKYNRKYRLGTCTHNELEEMKNCICKSYMNVLGTCTDLESEICPICILSDKEEIAKGAPKYTCGYIPRDFSYEEDEIDYMDELMRNIYNGAYRMHIIDDVGRIHHEWIPTKERYNASVAKIMRDEMSKIKEFINREE